MIEVKVYNNGFTITGHAGYDVMGKDIVCAAVSALSQTCVISLEKLTDDNVKCTESNGFMNLVCNNPSEAAKLILDVFNTGIEAVCEEYYKFVQLVRFSCDNI